MLYETHSGLKRTLPTLYETNPLLKLQTELPTTVGILGRKGSGKDTIARVLVEEFGFYQTSFAKRLYFEVAEAFGLPIAFFENRDTKETPMSELALSNCHNQDFWKVATLHLRRESENNTGSGWFINPVTREYVLSPRKVMQLYGTEYRRSEDNYYWVKWLDYDINSQKEVYGEHNDLVVVSDVREDYEAAYVKRRDNGFNLRTVRPDNPYDTGRGTSLHSSETRMDSVAFDKLLVNDKDVSHLQALTRNLFKG